MIWLKIGVCAFLAAALWLGVEWFTQADHPEMARDIALKQFDSRDDAARDVRTFRLLTSGAYAGGILAWLGFTILMLGSDIARLANRASDALRRNLALGLVGISLLGLTGCYRPYEPAVLETVETSETAFLLPLTGDTTKQEAFKSEELLAKNMVAVKEVQLPHRWLKTGYYHTDGKWVPSARLVKVDRAPVTREWTADPNSGTSSRNEAIWVMTSDGIQFSTGWTCTARIKDDKGAVKFLFNYPNGSLKALMDSEVRARIQAVFGEEVTDRPIKEMQTNSTPIFMKVRDDLTKFFGERGITITNIGITGGYVYVDPKIQEAMNEIFKANSQKAIAEAATQAQEEKNKAVILSAKGIAESEKTEKEGIAQGIRAVADAKAYEIEKAQQNLDAYLALKRLELENAKLERWNGQFPVTFFGGGTGQNLDMLLSVPPAEVKAPVVTK